MEGSSTLTKIEGKQGFATATSTEKLAANFPAISYSILGKTNLRVSPAGFGTYRVDQMTPHHETALKKALQQGINLIDTSANYTDGESEKLIGHVISSLDSKGPINRENIVIVSKAGYIQGQNYTLSKKREREGQPFPDLCDFDPGLQHCIHPKFLEEQLTLSLQRLQIPTLDIYLLHNPEYFLQWAQKNLKTNLQEIRKEYYRRIELAFKHLEKEVEKGRIRYYGVSSNTFPENVDSPQFTSLSKMLRIAEKISSDHHFSVVQFPMNFAETYPAWRLNQPDSEVSPTPNKTLLEICQENKLGVLINRPLNGILQKQNALVRFSDANPDQNLKKLLKDELKNQSESSSWLEGPKTLSQLAIRALRTTPPISCVLVGMRREPYVIDILDEIRRKVEPIKNPKEAWRHIQELF